MLDLIAYCIVTIAQFTGSAWFFFSAYIHYKKKEKYIEDITIGIFIFFFGIASLLITISRYLITQT